MAQAPAAKQRNPFYDNLKFILITFVVIGHFVGIVNDYDPSLLRFWRWVYLFHMPAFLFVSGMFAKSLYSDTKGLRINTIAFYVLMGILLYSGLWAWKHLYYATPKYDLLNMGSIPWYFFAMAGLGASLAIVAKVRGGAKVVMPVSIVLAVGAGFIDRFDDFLVLGRIFTYMPFFYAGYFASIEGYANTIAALRKKIWPVVLAAVFVVGSYIAFSMVSNSLAATMSGIATGHNPFSTLKAFPSRIDALIRLLDFAIAAGMIVALSLLTPTKHCAISNLGARTLQVYFLHPFVYYLIDGFKLFKPFAVYSPYAAFGMIALSILVVILLALPPWPEKFFQWLRRSIQIDKAYLPQKTE